MMCIRFVVVVVAFILVVDDVVFIRLMFEILASHPGHGVHQIRW